MILPGWRSHDWSLVAWLFGLLTVALIILPVWTHGDDSGWYSCGPLWNKAGGLATGCEHSGSYRHRLWFVFGSAALTLVAAALFARRRGTWSSRHAALFSTAAVLAAAIGTAAWKANDAVYVRPVYDFSATTLDVEPIARLSQPGDENVPWYRVAVTAASWPSTSTAVFVACRSEVVPESCELMWASGGFVTADTHGSIDALVDLRIPDGFSVIAGFDTEQHLGVREPWPAGTSVVAPIAMPADRDLPIVDRFDDPVPSPVSTTSTVPAS